MKRLGIELYGELIGTLQGADRATFDFEADPEAIEHYGVNSRILSAAIPLNPKTNRAKAKQRRNYFQELLPEGDQLAAMYAAARLASGDVLGFLAHYGRDVAGALQIWDLDDPREPATPELLPVTEDGVRDLLDKPLMYPLANRPAMGKTSLAGVQPKIVLARTGDGWAQAAGGAPSTHILKPLVQQHPTLIYDEEYGARIARALGLATHATWIAEFAGAPALVIERFDRDLAVSGGRIHQEDFNQALGAGGNAKYQEFGGVVSLRRVSEVLSVVGAGADRTVLARMIVLAVALGNLDMHAKNLGLIHHPNGSVGLAPAYDIVPHTHLAGVDGRMALAIGREYRHAALTRDHLVAEVASWGLRTADDVVDESLVAVAEAVDDEVPLPGADPQVYGSVLQFTENLCKGRPVGVWSH
ncbi:HipA domain-containing protein [Nocardia sp. NPDC024068]|uniref:type II toxin-antitoxin system HipA family toxin n=1 Tax=Nocardia sp. NPDC024068 TaxID=3157197 RepID=UPI0033D831D8